MKYAPWVLATVSTLSALLLSICCFGQRSLYLALRQRELAGLIDLPDVERSSSGINAAVFLRRIADSIPSEFPSVANVAADKELEATNIEMMQIASKFMKSYAWQSFSLSSAISIRSSMRTIRFACLGAFYSAKEEGLGPATVVGIVHARKRLFRDDRLGLHAMVTEDRRSVIPLISFLGDRSRDPEMLRLYIELLWYMDQDYSPKGAARIHASGHYAEMNTELSGPESPSIVFRCFPGLVSWKLSEYLAPVTDLLAREHSGDDEFLADIIATQNSVLRGKQPEVVYVDMQLEAMHRYAQNFLAARRAAREAIIRFSWKLFWLEQRWIKDALASMLLDRKNAAP